MSASALERTVTDEERRLFRLDDFPKTHSERRAFIFALTGFSAKPLDHRGWYLLNSSINTGLDLELDERTLQILSLMDLTLSGIRRFANMPHMHEIACDSTAAHTKQSINIIQQVVERAAMSNHSAPPVHIPPSMDTFRREAILGTWLHDMGELFGELTTASDMFNMSPTEREALSQQKNALEREVFSFACSLAAYATDRARPKLFLDAMDQVRIQAQHQRNITGRIAAIRSGMERIRTRYDLAADPKTEELLALYDRVEDKAEGNFLHPFVKTLESVEGHRYLQRNSSLLAHTQLSLITSNETIEGCKRCEKRLPELFEAAGSDFASCRLARAAAEFTYRSLAREFLPRQEDYVSLAPDFIRRDATPETEPRSNKLLPEASLSLLRDQIIQTSKRVAKVLEHYPPTKGGLGALQKEFQDILGALHASSLEGTRQAYRHTLEAEWKATGVNKPVYSRKEAGLLYRAAEKAVMCRFVPKSASLICLADTPELPKQIEQQMRDLDREIFGDSKVLKFGKKER